MTNLLADPSDGVAQLIQTALTPVFMLSGVGVLLNLFNTRLARVSDDLSHAADLLTREIGPADDILLLRQVARIKLRMWLLDACIMIGAIGGASACGAAFVLFLGSVSKSAIAGWLIGLFALALGCTMVALVVFLGDSVLAWQGLREEGPLPRSIKKPTS